jgi:putative spermidine/putrescine transport system ATP-binding protein
LQAPPQDLVLHRARSSSCASPARASRAAISGGSSHRLSSTRPSTAAAQAGHQVRVIQASSGTASSNADSASQPGQRHEFRRSCGCVLSGTFVPGRLRRPRAGRVFHNAVDRPRIPRHLVRPPRPIPSRMSPSRMAADILVQFAKVRKTFDGATLVVRDLDLGIRRGEFLTLLGPSGSGKTTTLMMLAGFEVPTAGEILLAGAPITRTPPHQRDIGVVFQSYALFPHMTVAENVAFPLSVRKRPRDEIATRVKRALDIVRLAGLDGRRPAQLSGGQQQRVALARALVFEPQLVLMDEPLGALDKRLREHMQLEIKHIHQRLGVTVVYVTHDQAEALTMSDRIAVFNHGAIEQIGTPAAVYGEPATAFVAQFVGENNRLDAVVEAAAGDGFCAVRLADGTRLRARAARPFVPGTPCVLSIRPEAAALDGGAENRLSGTVSELIYHGDHTRLRLALAGGADFSVKLPGGTAPAGLAPGGTVTAAFAAADCRALDSDT